MKTKVLVVAGPTASGKTGLGIALARRLDGEIVCADSMQIYTGMPIATAAPTAAERQAAVHHLAEILPPDTPFSVAQYCKLAAETVADIAARGKVPILVGGTGLFIDSFIDHIQFAHVQTNPDLRRELLAKAGAAPSGGTKAEARTADYYKKRPCPELCRMCADLCAEFIAAHPEGRCGVYKEDV